MSEAMTIEEQILLWDAVISRLNDNFEFWLTVSFAVIVASYIARNRLSLILKNILTALYLSVSTMLVLNMVAAIAYAGSYDAFGAFSSNAGFWDWLALGIRVGIWFLGTIASVAFIYLADRIPEGDA